MPSIEHCHAWVVVFSAATLTRAVARPGAPFGRSLEPQKSIPGPYTKQDCPLDFKLSQDGDMWDVCLLQRDSLPHIARWNTDNLFSEQAGLCTEEFRPRVGLTHSLTNIRFR